MTDLQKDLNEFKFYKKGIITINEHKSHPIFDLIDPLETYEGNVYLWITEIDNIPSKILYIGKAGKTILKRCNQHIGGFKGGSNKALKNSVELLKLLKVGTKIGIYSRHSDRMEILGCKNISLCSAEENALIDRYKNVHPLFNKI